MTIPEFSPGCFGSAVTFKRTDMICTACVFCSACEPVHLASKLALQQKLGVVLHQTPAKEKIKPEPINPTRIVLPEKVQRLIETIDKGGFNIIQSLKEGRNPFDLKFPYLAVFCHMLMRANAPFSRDLLQAAYTTRLRVSPAVARENAAIAIVVLMHVGAVRSVDGNLSLRN